MWQSSILTNSGCLRPKCKCIYCVKEWHPTNRATSKSPDTRILPSKNELMDNQRKCQEYKAVHFPFISFGGEKRKLKEKV